MSLDSGGGVSIVGIHGIGGIGKTTIAKAVYNKRFSEFDRCTFVENVREMLHQKGGVINLQKQIIANILRENFAGSISNASEGIGIMRDRISRFKFLMVLDDVDEEFEFDGILGNIKNFVSGSSFIITSRNVRVLSSLTEECKLYRVRAMSTHHALQLFCEHAFRGDSPPPSYETLAKDITSVAAGLPLTLKVVGSLLYKEKKEIWCDKLEQLKRIPEEKVVERLKISYDTLNKEAKCIFLDIACFFIGESKETPSYMWSDRDLFPITNINILIQRSIIELEFCDFQDQNLFRMHDQLRDMGREIVRQENIEHPWERSRIWSKEAALDMLRNKEGTNRVEGLRINSSDDQVAEELEIVSNLKNECFMNLSKLRYLDVQAKKLTRNFTINLPNLRWLRLEFTNVACMPKFHVENLVILELLSAVTDDWEGLKHIMKVARKLKVMKLLGSFLINYPDFPRSGSLEILYLEDFGRQWSHSNLDIRNLRNLKVLHLQKCELREIRGETIGMMKGLRELKIIINLRFETTSVREAFADIGDLQFLEILIVDPTGDGELTPLQENMLVGTKLPTSLKVLDTISPVANLPELVELEKLTVRYSEYGLQIPAADGSNMWWKLSRLEHLTLSSIKMTIPINTSSPSLPLLPSSLTTLLIEGCSELVWLPNLENLENLTEFSISGSPFLKEIPGLRGLKCSKILTITGLKGLCNLDGLDRLYSLTHLRLSDCDALETLPSMAPLSKLLHLKIAHCHGLTEIYGLGGLESLQMLRIDDAHSLTCLLGLETLLSCFELQTLVIADCPLLTSQLFHDLDDDRGSEAPKLYLLQRLYIRRATLPLLQIFSRMIQLLMFPCLMALTLSGVDIGNGDTELRLDGLESMEQLVDLHLFDLASVRRLPSLSQLGKLEGLTVANVPNLQEIEGLAGLKSLEELALTGCTSLERLPADVLYGLGRLESLDIRGCTSLKDRSALRKLEPKVKIQWPGSGRTVSGV